MARPAAKIIYKLPAPFIERHRETLDAWLWSERSQMPLSEALPDVADLAGVVFELAPSGRNIVVRSTTAGDMLRVRKYADGLGNA